jgi:hypothetical protein
MGKLKIALCNLSMFPRAILSILERHLTAFPVVALTANPARPR